MSGEDRAARPAAGGAARRFNESVAAHITLVTTSMWFLYGLVLFVGLWMRFSPILHIDTAPSYPVMLYWVNLFQALMLPILAVGQSVLSRASEKRQQHEAEVIDRLDHLTGRILALEEGHATLRQTRHADHAAVMEQLDTINRHLRTAAKPAGEGGGGGPKG